MRKTTLVELSKHKRKKKGSKKKSPRSQFITELMRLFAKHGPDKISEAFVKQDVESFTANFKPVYDGLVALATPPEDEEDQASVTASSRRIKVTICDRDSD